MPQLQTQFNSQRGVESDTEPTYIAANGNIIVHPKRITHHLIDGTAGILALTINAPTQADDGKIVTFSAMGVARAHVLTQPVVGFNGKGAAGTATWGGLALGEHLQLIAHGGNWWTLALGAVVIA